jgi:hypothetical protein
VNQITKKIRFEILKRDNFTCQYCGKKAPETEMEVDHIIPVSRGGTHDYSNMTTSCFACNKGKKNVLLTETLLIEKPIVKKEPKIKEELFRKTISIPFTWEELNKVKRYIDANAYCWIGLTKTLLLKESEKKGWLE